MKVTRLSATAHSLQVQVEGLGVRVRSFVFVCAETDVGTVGYGLTGRVGAQRQHVTVARAVNDEFAPLVIGEDPLETDRIWERLYRESNPRSTTGVWSSAMSAVDIALWDLKGKALGQPVWKLLGGARARARAYVTYGYPEYTDEQLVKFAELLASEGHDALKMVVGEIGDAAVDRDIARVRAVRRALGPSVQLMIDANQRLSLAAALRLSRGVEDCDLTWFEEPVFGNDVLLLAELRRRTRVPLAAGQSEGHRFRHRELLLGQAVDFAQPNVCYVGGYTEALRVAGFAQTLNIPLANGGGWPHHNMHLHAGVAGGSFVEFHVEMWKAGEAIYDQAPRPDHGWVQLPTAPGLGLEPDLERLEASRDA